MSYDIAVIGLGIIGRRMIEQSRIHGGLQVATAWDQSAEARSSAARDYPWLTIADDAASAMSRPGVDLVYVAVPPLHHHEYVVAAASLGKAIFCEKPLTVSARESQALVHLASQTHLRHAVNYVFASSHAVNAIASLLAQPDFGLRSIEIRMRFFQWPRDWQSSAQWLSNADQGGPTREVLSHYVYLLLRLFGAVELESSSVRRTGPATAEHFSQAMLDARGTPVSMTCLVGGAAPDEVLVQFHGRSRSLELRDWYRLSINEGGNTSPVDGLPTDPRLATYQAQLDQLCNLLAGREHSLADFAVAYRVQEIVEAILSSQTESP